MFGQQGEADDQVYNRERKQKARPSPTLCERQIMFEAPSTGGNILSIAQRSKKERLSLLNKILQQF